MYLGKLLLVVDCLILLWNCFCLNLLVSVFGFDLLPGMDFVTDIGNSSQQVDLTLPMQLLGRKATSFLCRLRSSC